MHQLRNHKPKGVVMFWMKAIGTGVVVGVIGYFVVKRWLWNRLCNMSFGQQLVSIAVLGLLFTAATMAVFAKAVSDMTGIPVGLILAFAIPGMVSFETVVIILAVWYNIVFEGYAGFERIVNEVLTPLVACTIGFLLGFIPSQEGTPMLDADFIAVANFLRGAVSGGISAFIAYLVGLVLGCLFPSYD